MGKGEAKGWRGGEGMRERGREGAAWAAASGRLGGRWVWPGWVSPMARNARGCVLWWFKWCLGGVRRSPRAALGPEQSWSPAPFQNTCDEDVDF